MTVSLEECAHEILEVVLLIMRDIRTEFRRRRTFDLSVPQFRTLTFIDHQPGSPYPASSLQSYAKRV